MQQNSNRFRIFLSAAIRPRRMPQFYIEFYVDVQPIAFHWTCMQLAYRKCVVLWFLHTYSMWPPCFLTPEGVSRQLDLQCVNKEGIRKYRVGLLLCLLTEGDRVDVLVACQVHKIFSWPPTNTVSKRRIRKSRCRSGSCTKRSSKVPRLVGTVSRRSSGAVSSSLNSLQKICLKNHQRRKFMRADQRSGSTTWNGLRGQTMATPDSWG